MATASVTITPECSICFEYLKMPKILPCGHTFCLGCVDRYIGDRTATFPCPVCQQDIKIPDGGTRMFTTNFIVPAYPHKTSPTAQATGTLPPTAQVTGTTSPTTHQTDKTSSKVKYHCLCHRKRPIEYYCLTCHCVLCHKCYVKEHNGHEFLDEECETARDKATQLVLASEKFIQNKIKDLEETHVALVEAREKLQRFTEDACSRITKQSDKIIADIKASRERIVADIQNKSEESQSKLTNTDKKIIGDIKSFKLNLETNFPSLTEDCSLQMLVSLEKIKELEELCKDVKVETPSVVQYLDWVEKDFSLNIDVLGSTVLKQYHIPKLHESNSYQFHFDMDYYDYEEDCLYSQDKFSYSNLVWSCCVGLSRDGHLSIFIELLPEDNPRLNYCNIDCTISVLNIDDDSRTILKTFSNVRVETGFYSSSSITWYEYDDKNNDNLQFNHKFLIQFDISQIREIALV